MGNEPIHKAKHISLTLNLHWSFNHPALEMDKNSIFQLPFWPLERSQAWMINLKPQYTFHQPKAGLPVFTSPFHPLQLSPRKKIKVRNGQGHLVTLGEGEVPLCVLMEGRKRFCDGQGWTKPGKRAGLLCKCANQNAIGRDIYIILYQILIWVICRNGNKNGWDNYKKPCHLFGLFVGIVPSFWWFALPPKTTSQR